MRSFSNDRREKFGELLIFAWNLRKESYLGLKLVTESLKQAYLYLIILQGAFLRSRLDMSPVRRLRNTRTTRRDILLVAETVIRMKETNVTFWNYAFSSGDNFYTSSDTIGYFI